MAEAENLNMMSVSVKEFGRLVINDIQNGFYGPVLGLGKAGVGKTTSVKALARKHNLGYRELRLAHIPQTDLIGMPDISTDENGNKVTHYAQQGILPPSVWDENYNDGKGGWRGLSEEEGGFGEVGILVLDEVTSCSQDVRAAAFQLLDDQRALHEYHLPDKWKCIAIGNGVGDGGVFNGLETAFITRCMGFRIEPDVESWKSYAIQKGLNPAIIAFIELFPEKMHTMNGDSDELEKAEAVPRTWEMLSIHLDADEAAGLSSNDFIVRAHACGCIGNTTGQEFLALYHKNKDTIDPKPILQGKANPEDAKMFITTGSNQDGRQIGTLTIKKVVRALTDAMNDTSADAAKFDDMLINVINWLIDITKVGSPVDLSIVGIRDLVDSIPEAASVVTQDDFDERCPKFTDFCIEHQVIVS